MPTLSARQKKLLDLLCSIETGGGSISDDELERQVKENTGYKSLRTYRSKYLDKVLIFPQSGGVLQIKGTLGLTEAKFAELLSQKKNNYAEAPMKYDTEKEWLESLSDLAILGSDRGFKIPSEDRDLFEELFQKDA